MKPRTAVPLLDADNTALISGGVSMVAASRTLDHVPQIARAIGCHVSRDRRKLTVLFPTEQAAELLQAVRATGVIAVVFTQPSTHRTIQLKGADASVAPASKAQRAVIEPYAAAFADELGSLGYTDAFVRMVLDCEGDDFVAVTFTIAAAFSQTPGPRAGAPLAR